MTHSRLFLILTGAAVVLVAALLIVGRTRGPDSAAEHGVPHEAQWVCPMHPDVRQPQPGRCPICGMALEQPAPADQRQAHGEAHGARAAAANPSRPSVAAPGDDAAEPRAAIEIDGRRRQLIGVRTVTVGEESLTRRLRTSGIVRFDEARWTDVNVRTEGWIQHLHVNRTGETVRRNQPLVAIYSPELATVQAEYLLAVRTRDAMAGGAAAVPVADADRLVAAARQRLGRWDLPPEHLAELSQRGAVPPVVTFRSPVSGIVMEKRAVQGMRVMPGDSLFRIVDASMVWVEADVYEAELSAARVGQRAEVSFDAWPGERLAGRVSWVSPALDEASRTARVRIELANRDGRLKPGMFAQAELEAALPRGPVIPRDALLDTGARQFVFVTDGAGYFEPRPVRAGHRVDGQVQVLEGVRVGEHVAASATFFIDSESQLRAALDGYRPTPDAAAAAPAGEGAVEIALSSTPDPPSAGMTRFEVRVTTPDGAPVSDAQVTLLLFMPPMPSMSMPAMRSESALGHAGAGVYRGSIDVMMNGRWEATVTVTRGAERLGTKRLTVIAR